MEEDENIQQNTQQTATKKVAKKKTKKKTAIDNRSDMTLLCERDQLGLINNLPHVFKENGRVDWKAMIPKKYLAFNKTWFENNDIETPKASNLEEVENPEDYTDEQLVILLDGFKTLLEIRGFNCIRKEVVESSFERAVVKTTIEFIPNYENGHSENLIVDGIANATIHNTNEQFQVYLEAIASNRSFIRALRNALKIEILGNDELPEAKYDAGTEESGAVDPRQALAEAASEYVGEIDGEETKLDTFEKFRRFLTARKFEDAHGWEDWSSIPLSTVWKLLRQIKN